MNKVINEMEIKFKALSINESFARASIAGFCLQLNPSLDELTDVKTAVSEAVTNSIVHAYKQIDDNSIVVCRVKLFEDNTIQVTVRDFGVGIANLDEAKQPFFTTRPTQERSGMGFTVMESFMDEVDVSNQLDGGLKVVLIKKFKKANIEREIV